MRVSKEDMKNSIEPIEETPKRSFRELRQLLKKKKSLEVEIMSLTNSTIVYECPKTGYKFTLNGVGATESIELDLLTTMANRYKGFFRDHLLTIVDFEDDDFTIEEVMEYLGILSFYEQVENKDMDYINVILNDMDNYEFEKLITTCSPSLVTRVGERAIELYKRGKFDSHTKPKLIGKRLGLEDFFDVVDADIDDKK